MSPELLSPARDSQIAREAILAGADSVYIGSPRFGARREAANTVSDIAELCRFAHLYGCKVYVALNTILTDAELPQASLLAENLWNAGADALIVQDMGLLQVLDRRIRLHASTQCHIDTPDKARFLESAGFETLVLARETSLGQISATAKAVKVPLECFVHGALCVSYSGQCYLSYFVGRRSGNRGECAQACRMLYEFIDADAKAISKPAHYLSLRDMNRISALGDMLDAGVSIFKIEGRLKDAVYVRNITAAYRAALDAEMARRNLDRPSFGKSVIGFEPDPKKSFSRLFCLYHLRGVERGCASFSTPKARGEFLGTPMSVFEGGFFFRNASKIFSNGDGLFFEDENGEGYGSGVSGVFGDKVCIGRPEERILINRRAKIWRNRNVKFDAQVEAKIVRKMSVKITISENDNAYIFSIATDDSRKACFAKSVEKSTCEVSANFVGAKSRMGDSLAKLGDTVFECDAVKIDAASLPFLRAAEVNEIRRELVAGLEEAILADYEKKRTSYKRPLPRKTDFEVAPFDCDARANVANSEAVEFYSQMGFAISSRAPETGGDMSCIPLMRTRHCILRELGMCRKEGKLDPKFRPPFYIKSTSGKFRVEFDCKDCQMFLYSAPAL